MVEITRDYLDIGITFLININLSKISKGLWIKFTSCKLHQDY